MNVLIAGVTEYATNWTAVRRVVELLGHDDVLITDGTYGVATAAERILKTIPRASRPKLRVERAEHYRYAPELARERRALRQIKIDSPHVLVLFADSGAELPEMPEEAIEPELAAVVRWCRRENVPIARWEDYVATVLER